MRQVVYDIRHRFHSKVRHHGHDVLIGSLPVFVVDHIGALAIVAALFGIFVIEAMVEVIWGVHL